MGRPICLQDNSSHGHIEDTLVSIFVVQLLQVPSNRLHNTVSSSNSIIGNESYCAVACQRLILRCLFRVLCPATDLYVTIYSILNVVVVVRCSLLGTLLTYAWLIPALSLIPSCCMMKLLLMHQEIINIQVHCFYLFLFCSVLLEKLLVA
jgi:hypothetical protein